MVSSDKEPEVVEIPVDQVSRTNGRQRLQNLDASHPVQDLDVIRSTPIPSSSQTVSEKDPLANQEESINKVTYPLRRSMRRGRSRMKQSSKSCPSKQLQIQGSGNQNQPASSSSSSLLAPSSLSSVGCGRGGSRKGAVKSFKAKQFTATEQVYKESNPTVEGMMGNDSGQAERPPLARSRKQGQQKQNEVVVDGSLEGPSRLEVCRSETSKQIHGPEKGYSKVEGQNEWVDISLFPSGTVVVQEEQEEREDAADDPYHSEEYFENEMADQNRNISSNHIHNQEGDVFLLNQWSQCEENQRSERGQDSGCELGGNQEKDCREVRFKDMKMKEIESRGESLLEEQSIKGKGLQDGMDLKMQKCYDQEAEVISLDASEEGSEVQRHTQHSGAAIEDDEVIVVGRGENATLEPEKECRSRVQGDGHREGSPTETAVCLHPAPGDTEDALPAPPSPVNIFQIDGMSIILSSRLIEQTDKMRERLGIFEGLGPVAGSFSDISIPEGILEEEGLVSDIRADEAMPPRGELSGQEGMGSGSNYSDPGMAEDAVPKPEGTTIWTSGGFSLFPASARQGATQADLLPGSGETWTSGSPFKGSQESNIGGAVPETTTAKKRQRTKKSASSEGASKATGNASKTKTKRLYHCWNCLEVFNCPKERRVHQREKHNGEKSVSMTPEIESAMAPMEPVQLKEQDGLAELDTPLVKNEEKDDKSEVRETVEREKNKVTINMKGDKGEIANIEASHPCSDCDRSFPSLRSLTAHRRAAHRDSRFKCPTCMEKFLTSVDFTNHVRTVHPLECSMCGKQFSRQQNLRLHLKRHLSVRPYKCTQCDKAFVTNQKMEEHLNSHTGRTPFQCPLCPRAFRRHSNLIQHRKHHHMKVKRKVRDFFCHCGAVFHSVKKLEWHKETHEDKPKTCPHCSDRFVHKAGLTRHIRQVHDKRYVPTGAREDVNVECPVCSAVYLKSSLHIHMRVHSGERPFSCGICGKGFATKWNLQLHRWVHASPHSKPFKCATCKAAYHRRVDYVAHIRSHRKVRPYVCNTCGRRFMRKYNCVRHSREHETGKKFECSICHKRFHRRYYLKEHLRIHTGLRPYVCHVCGKASGTKSNMNKHVRIHHAREPVNTEG
ncbi:hypothetical protein J437_LFUL010492 [Ladona fulva]|uniref:C2H2-type domain-containing protein n=1 Tax=Ladona fulva TaxID=123851 RepID=A0A8K0NYN8_LADFU|nr:hypothetical protein J437_LFUL010492 [Ladona fulva]